MIKVTEKKDISKNLFNYNLASGTPEFKYE